MPRKSKSKSKSKKNYFDKYEKPTTRTQNPPPGTVPLVVGTLVVGLAAGGILLYSSQASAAPKKTKNECAPYKFITSDVRNSILTEIQRGVTDPAQISVSVATEMFGIHPDGGSVTFPPNPANAKKGVICVWNKVVILVAEVIDEEGIDDDPGVDFVPRDPYDDGYPWEVPSLERNNYPTPGMFANVGGGNDAHNYAGGVSTMLRAALNSGLAMAASKGIDTSVAQERMSKIGSTPYRNLMKQMAAETFCSKFNDGLYGRVWNGDKNSSHNLWNWVPNGRSTVYLPQHNDVLAMLGRGEQPRRAITLNARASDDGKSFIGHIPGNGRRQPVYWIPAINLERLGGPNPVVTTAGMKWSDGSSTREPPPVVQRLGINLNGVALPGGPGCR